MDDSKSVKFSSSEKVFDSAYSDGEQLSSPIAPTEQSHVDITSVSEHATTPTALVSGLPFQEQRYYQGGNAELEKQAEQPKVEIENQSSLDELNQLYIKMSKEYLYQIEVVKRRNAKIEELERCLNQKDTLIRRLREEKDEMERQFNDMKKKYSEADNSKHVTEQRLATMEKDSHNKLKGLKEKERQLVLELQETKTDLAEARCAWLEEVQALKDKNHQLEMNKMKQRLIQEQDIKDLELWAELLKTEKEYADNRQNFGKLPH